MGVAAHITITETITDMAIPNDARDVRLAAFYYLLHLFVRLLGVGAVAWGGLVLPIFWQQAPPHRVASEVLKGNGFKQQTLSDEANQVEAVEPSSFCSPAGLHSAVVLRLAILDQAITAADRASIDSAYTGLYQLVRTELACAPSSSFGWLTLFWLDAIKRGITASNLQYLRLSYEYGPNESWIALWRNRLAVAVFARLPTDLQNAALDEFVKLVDTGNLYQETAGIFEHSQPAVQTRIVTRLKTVPLIYRQAFARVLYDKGMDVDIPDVNGLRPTRPWR
jgi:hypothetical protein